jgi:hypothetical protein
MAGRRDLIEVVGEDDQRHRRHRLGDNTAIITSHAKLGDVGVAGGCTLIQQLPREPIPRPGH